MIKISARLFTLIALIISTNLFADQSIAVSRLYALLISDAEQRCRIVKGLPDEMAGKPAGIDFACCFPKQIELDRRKLSQAQLFSIIGNPGERSVKIITTANKTCRLIGAASLKKELMDSCSLSAGAKMSSDPIAYCACYREEAAKLSNEKVADMKEQVEAIAFKKDLSESDKAEIERIYLPLKTTCQ